MHFLLWSGHVASGLENTLYISRVQARYIHKVTTDMIYDPAVGLSCNYYPGL